MAISLYLDMRRPTREGTGRLRIAVNRGKRRLLSIADSYASHKDYLHHLNDALKRIGNVTYGKQGRKEVSPLFPKLSSYWARHSWATTAGSEGRVGRACSKRPSTGSPVGE